MPYRKEKFVSGAYYHLFNRGIDKGLIFFERENYLFFLRQIRKYFTHEIMTIIAYCLMPNHYHLLVQLKTDELGLPIKTEDPNDQIAEKIANKRGTSSSSSIE